MRKSNRVKKDRDFQVVFKQGKSYANRKFVVYAKDRELGRLRVGLSVSKKLGKAVTRNRIKRRLRHVLMGLEANLLPYDLVIIARKGVEDLSYADIQQHLTHVLKLANLYQED